MRGKFALLFDKPIFAIRQSRLFLVGTVCLALVALLFATLILRTASANQSPQQPSNSDPLWQDISPALLSTTQSESLNRFTAARTLRLNREALASKLSQAPRESKGTTNENTLTLPLPDGRFAQFRLENSSLLPTDLAAKYPEIQSYRGQSIDLPEASMRCDWTPRGFHATILFADRLVSVLPLTEFTTETYVSFYNYNQQSAANRFYCDVKADLPKDKVEAKPEGESYSLGAVRRQYRIAIATTQEYTNQSNLGGGSAASSLASVNTWLNGVNVIYERDMATRFVLATGNDQIIFTAEPDGLTNSNSNTLLNEISGVIKNKINPNNYDLGHVLGLSNGGGGVARLASVCKDADTKGSGVSMVDPNEVPGAPFSLSTIAHEIGHQFNATHTFASACDGARQDETAFESASGLTIMSYAGVCTPAIVPAVSPHFHGASIVQMFKYMTDATGGACATTTNTGNTAPTLNIGAAYTIPKGTPFTLTATGNDADASDVANLTYSWEQVDAGPTPPYISATGPLFRPFNPTKNPARMFPSLSYILSNANVPPATIAGLQTAENLPDTARDLSFICTVRDNRGGVVVTDVIIKATNAGPFAITTPNTALSWAGNSNQTVTWNVNGTNAAPINCQNVRITMSIDGGQTFPYVLAASTANNGSANVSVPASLVSTKARVKVEAVGNIFFDISDTNINLTPGDSCPAISTIAPQIGAAKSNITINGINFTNVSAVKFANNQASDFLVVNDNVIIAKVPDAAVTGAITISQPNCPDKQTSTFTVSPNAEITLQADDGTIESAARFGGIAPVYYVNRLKPAQYPATITAVSIYVHASVPGNTDYKILVGTNSGGGTNIDGLAFQETAAKTPLSTGQFFTVPVPNVTITGGDFIVGFSHVPQSGVFPIGLDTNGTIKNLSYYSTSLGINFTQETTRNYGIRAIISNGAICTSQCAPNTAPSITAAAPLNRLQGSAGTTAQIATVNDAETATGLLAVTATSVPTGISITNISNTNGTISATVAADCNAATGNNVVTLSVSDGNLTATANLTINVAANIAPILSTYANTTLTTGAAANNTPNAAPTDNGSIVSITASAPNFTGSFSVNTLTGVVSISNAGPTGNFTVTLTATDNCGTTATKTFTLSVLVPGAGLEADVAPRSNGNGSVSISDWAQIGRFATGLDTVSEGSEFQRADCAPRSTFGDGKLTIGDWVQAGRYAAGLDEATAAAGPSSPSAPTLAATNENEVNRLVRAVNANWQRGQANALRIELESQGDENALGFSLNFDPSAMSFINAQTENGASVTVNSRFASAGKIGFLVALPAGQVFAAGTRTALLVNFLPAGGFNTTTTRVSFSDQIISRAIADVNANVVAAINFANAEIAVSGQSAAMVSAANYSGNEAAPESILAAFGVDLATTTEAATQTPLPEILGGSRVSIKDSVGQVQPAKIFFASASQINYLVPANLAEGLATITITNRNGAISHGLINVKRTSPGLFSADSTGTGVAAANVQRIRGDGSESFASVSRFDTASGKFAAIPIDLNENDQVFLALYGTGIRASNLSAVQATIDGVPVAALYAGTQGFFAGVDQINLPIPRILMGRGTVEVKLLVDDKPVNAVKITLR